MYGLTMSFGHHLKKFFVSVVGILTSEFGQQIMRNSTDQTDGLELFEAVIEPKAVHVQVNICGVWQASPVIIVERCVV